MADQTVRLDAGRVSLDFMATLGHRCGERLPDPPALEAWLRAAGLADETVAVQKAGLEAARELRAALFGVIHAELHDSAAPPASLAVINDAAAVPASAPRLIQDDQRVRAEWPAADVAEALGRLARDVIDLLAGPERALLRECAAEDCSGIYVDASRGRRRRWCSSARCGNRARVAAHRARRSGAIGEAEA